MRRSSVVLAVTCSVIGALSCQDARAQFSPPTPRSGEQPPIFREEPRPAPPPVLPPVVPPPLPGPQEPLSRERVFVREIRITGNTIFSAEEIGQVAAPYVNRELTAEDLESLRVALTLLYVNRGYVNSGAILPDQTVTEGVVTYQVIEGGLA